MIIFTKFTIFFLVSEHTLSQGGQSIPVSDCCSGSSSVCLTPRKPTYIIQCSSATTMNGRFVREIESSSVIHNFYIASKHRPWVTRNLNFGLDVCFTKFTQNHCPQYSDIRCQVLLPESSHSSTCMCMCVCVRVGVLYFIMLAITCLTILSPENTQLTVNHIFER